MFNLSPMSDLSPNRVLAPELSFVEWASKVLNGELPYEPYAELWRVQCVKVYMMKV